MFPCYRRWTYSGEIVEFTSPQEGTTINDLGNGLGYHSKTFEPYDSPRWEPCEDPRVSKTNKMLRILNAIS